jgi:hypothetical protein
VRSSQAAALIVDDRPIVGIWKIRVLLLGMSQSIATTLVDGGRACVLSLV